MGKLIIHVDDMKQEDMLPYIGAVIEQGRISDSPMGKKYCHVSMFKDGITVATKKPSSTTDTFYVYREDKNE